MAIDQQSPTFPVLQTGSGSSGGGVGREDGFVSLPATCANEVSHASIFAHHLCSPIPNRPWTGPGQGLGIGDP